MSKKIHIPDEGLRRAIDYQGIKVIYEKVDQEDLEGLKDFDWTSDGIGEHDPELFITINALVGLEYAVNLTGIGLTGNNINSLGALKNMNNLESGWFAYNSITDISGLSGKHSLKTVDLANNKYLSDVSALSGLKSLQNVYLGNTDIKDFSIFKEIPDLRVLSLWGYTLEPGDSNWEILLDLAENKVEISIEHKYREQFDKELAKRKVSSEPNGTQDELFTALTELDKTDISLLWQQDGPKAQDKDGNTVLHRILMTDLKTEDTKKLIKLCIDNRSDINAQNREYDKATPLVIAMKNNKDLSIIEFLLEHGSRTDIPDKNPALCIALEGIREYRKDRPEYFLNQQYLQLLLDKGADISLSSVFIMMCGYADIELVSDAIKKGVDINCQFDNSTPLTMAVRKNRIDVAKLLLEHDADPNLPNGFSQTPMFLVKSIEMFDLLIENGWNSTIRSYAGETPLFEIAEWGCDEDENVPIALELIDRLVQLGFSVNAQESDSQTIIFKIASQGARSIHIVEKLVEYGANINAMQREYTPFDQAYGNDTLKKAIKKLGGCSYKTYVKRLLKALTPDITPKTLAWSGLIELVENGKADEIPDEIKNRVQSLINDNLSDIGKLLSTIDPLHMAILIYLEQGLHGKDNKDNTLLHLVAHEVWRGDNIKPQKRDEILKVLIDEGLDITLLNGSNESALYTYTYWGQNVTLKGIQLLTDEQTVNSVVDKYPIAPIAQKRGELLRNSESTTEFDSILDFLVEQGTNLTPYKVFVELCNSGRVDLVRKAIEDGADPNECEHVKDTGLAVAVKNDNLEVIEFLLAKAKVDPNGRYEIVGKAPMHEVQSLEALNLLIKHGADTGPIGGYDHSKPLFNIAGRRFTDPTIIINMVKQLIEQGEDIHERNDSGKSAYDLLTERVELEIQEYVKTLKKPCSNL